MNNLVPPLPKMTSKVSESSNPFRVSVPDVGPVVRQTEGVSPLSVEISGIVGDVTRDVATKVRYPALFLPDDLVLSEGSWKVLSQLVETRPTAETIQLYGGGMYIGSVSSVGIPTLLRLFGTQVEKVKGFLTEGREISPRLFHAL